MREEEPPFHSWQQSLYDASAASANVGTLTRRGSSPNRATRRFSKAVSRASVRVTRLALPEAKVAAFAVNHQALHPRPRPGRLDVQHQADAVAMSDGFRVAHLGGGEAVCLTSHAVFPHLRLHFHK